jgi:hypothetical protein
MKFDICLSPGVSGSQGKRGESHFPAEYGPLEPVDGGNADPTGHSDERQLLVCVHGAP